ncbi:hypothetical protein BST61_g1379 [Cercospora zeina]
MTNTLRPISIKTRSWINFRRKVKQSKSKFVNYYYVVIDLSIPAPHYTVYTVPIDTRLEKIDIDASTSYKRRTTQPTLHRKQSATRSQPPLPTTPPIPNTTHPSTPFPSQKEVAMSLPSKKVYLKGFTPLEKHECPICYENMTQPTQTPCRHTFCYECLHTWVQENNTSARRALAATYPELDPNSSLGFSDDSDDPTDLDDPLRGSEYMADGTVGERARVRRYLADGSGVYRIVLRRWAGDGSFTERDLDDERPATDDVAVRSPRNTSNQLYTEPAASLRFNTLQHQTQKETCTYCQYCIKKWLEASNTCPTCRTVLYQRPVDQILQMLGIPAPVPQAPQVAPAQQQQIAPAPRHPIADDRSDGAMDVNHEEAPGLEDYTNDQIRDKPLRGPMILSSAALHRRVQGHVQRLRRFNNLAATLDLVPALVFTVSELPECFDDILTYDTRYRFSWNARDRQYNLDHISATRAVAALAGLNRLSEALHEYFNAPAQDDLLRELYNAVSGTPENLANDYPYVLLN